MTAHPTSNNIAEDLAALEEACSNAVRELSTSRTVRETLELADISVPHHLQSIARGKVHSLTRLPRVRDMRVEEVVNSQLSELSHERSEVVASREFDRIRASDWTLLRSQYPDLYTKAMQRARLILDNKLRKAR